MFSKSFATIRTEASEDRLHDLVDQLKTHGCRVPLIDSIKRLDFDVSDCTIWWIAEGGLRHLFEDFEDVVIWVDDFFDEAEFKQAIQRRSFVEA